MKNKLKYGCVGAGGIAEGKHLDGYSKLEDVEIVAICDTNTEAAEKVAQKFGIPNVFSDYNEMLDKVELDFISVCTPNFLHAPVSIEAMKRGIHVHCEKPVALNAHEAVEMLKARDMNEVGFMLALNNRFTNESYFVKEYVEAGMLGEIYHAKCGWRRRRGIPGKGGWFTNKKLSGGGPLIDLGVHLLDLTLYFMGYPQPLSVSGTTYSKFSDSNLRNTWYYGKSNEGVYDVEDMAVGFLRLENKVTVDFEFSWASNVEKDEVFYELLGTKGGISFANGNLKIYTEVMDTLADITPNINYPIKAMNEFEHFVSYVKNGGEPVAPLEHAVDMMKIIDGIYKSSEENREVMV